jgi:hypothetical protein
MREGVGQPLLTVTEKIWRDRDEKLSLLQQLECAYSFFKSTKEVFSVQKEWQSPNMLSTMVQ